jgi:hypothetical protein
MPKMHLFHSMRQQQMYKLSHSSRKWKKFDVVTPDGHKVSFGDNRYSDYTQHHDDERKRRYLTRHQSAENWRNLETAGAWSRWLLWNQPSIAQSARDMERRFGIRISAA